jgi:cytochrome c oxidase subunit 2
VDRAENIALLIAGALMTLFFGALLYSTAGLDISLPTCVTDVAPFAQGQVIDKGDNHYEVHMVARMWAFDPPEVRLPPGADVDLYLSSLDVTHGMYVEHTDVNLMAVPGAVNAARVRFDHEGVYPVICHEYCGLGHQNMMGKFVIVKGATVPPPAAAAGGAAPSSLEELGAKVFEVKGCNACHSVDGSPGVGPTMKGLYRHETEMEDGARLLADEAHIEEEIREPSKHIVKGFQPVMPEVPLTDEEMKALIAYIRSLS